MPNAIMKQIDYLINEGSDINQDVMIPRWSKQVATFLQTTHSYDQAMEFLNLKDVDLWDTLAMRLGLLQGIAAKARDDIQQQGNVKSKIDAQQSISALTPHETNKVFIVHGHDEAAKEATARFLEKIGLNPIILHEQASGGRTIIEKFEKYSRDVGFAVVLLTPDDLGTAQEEPNNMQSRARQNVVLELGFFLGRLTRNRVCALHKGEVELPSDIQGVIYVEMDDKGAWKAKLAQEFVQAKYTINLNGLVGG